MAHVTCYIHAQWHSYAKEWSFSTFAQDMSEYGYILLETREIEFESPSDLMLKAQLIRALRNKKTKVQADCQVALGEIDAEIQELLALEDQSGREFV